MKNRSIKWYGWMPDFPDHRDRKFIHGLSLNALPVAVDLRSKCPQVVDQGPLGSCTANAIAAAHEFEQMRQGRLVYVPDGAAQHDPSKYAFAPSRLFIYYNERLMENTVNEDSGAQIRDGIKTLTNYGACSAKTWPYHVDKYAETPPKAAYAEAKAGGMALQYHSVDNTCLCDLLACLSQGTPVVFGFTVYESFESDAVAQTGVVPLPKRNESVLGGHAVLAVGYDRNRNVIIARNSWGTDWGMAGYFTMPFDYVTNPNLADDFWAITQVR